MLRITLAIILISALPSCNKCIDEGNSCADSFSFYIVDKTNGQNLLFGPNAMYNADSVYLTTTLPGYTGKMSYAESSLVKSTLLIPVDTFFLRFSATDTDTLLMQYDFVKDQCCVNGRYGRVSAITYNGFTVEKVGSVFNLKK